MFIHRLFLLKDTTRTILLRELCQGYNVAMRELPEWTISSPKSILYLLLALALVRGIIYASIVPPWQAPDENAQFERARAALTEMEWNSTSANPPLWYDDLIKSMVDFEFWDFVDTPRQTYSPDKPVGLYIGLYQEIYDGLYGSRFAYALIGLPLFWAHNQDIALQLYLVRLNTVLMNVGIVLFSYLITRLIFPQDIFVTLGVPILIIFNPQHTHLLSTVNNGNLAELLATVALYFLVQIIIRGFTWINVSSTLLFSVGAMWAKATAYFLPFALATVGLFYLWQYRRHWAWLLPGFVFGGGLIFYFAPERLKQLAFDAFDGLNQGNFYLDSIVPIDLFSSFWAMPGWTSLELYPFWYQLLAISCLMALFGLLSLSITRGKLIYQKEHQPRIQALFVLLVSAIVAIGVLLIWNTITHSIVYRQGRSIYPVIVPICIFLMLGWQQFIPARWNKEGLVAITMSLLLFDTMVLFNYIIPFFYSRY